MPSAAQLADALRPRRAAWTTGGRGGRASARAGRSRSGGAASAAASASTSPTARPPSADRSNAGCSETIVKPPSTASRTSSARSRSE